MPQSSNAGELILEWLELTGIRQDSLGSEYGQKKVQFHQMLHNKNPKHEASVLMSKIMSDKGITLDKLDELRELKGA
ncbi:hypothetical protein KQH98_06110 [Lactococcus lactis]|uniref:hypothetical protein n=1 Tax=Lactococcus lactis TaxID=1358 RepID=UPI001C111B15|nr:hypothetical protein [Lactococcus lactis]MBU5242884.1 hypothetical protein [Lactococcus lactis]